MKRASPLPVLIAAVVAAILYALPSPAKGQAEGDAGENGFHLKKIEPTAPPRAYPPPERPAQPRRGSEPPKDDFVWHLLGTTMAVQGSGLVIAGLITFASGDQFSDRNTLLAWGLYAGISPAVSTTVGYFMTRRSRRYGAGVPGMLIGGYLGAAASFGLAYLYIRADDPKVDGEYDGGYFEENTGRNIAGLLAMWVAPIVLVTAGVVLGHLKSRKEKTPRRLMRLAPPTPILLPAAARGSGAAPGLNLLSGTF